MKKFKVVEKITCINNYIKEKQEFHHYSSFLIEPLCIGQGITFGNALRRALLSELSGYAITGVRINDLKYEFKNSSGIREDTLEILLNLKEIIIKGPLISRNEKLKSKICILLSIKGPSIITGGLLNLSLRKFSNYLEIKNPSQYVCTIINKFKFYLELDIEKSKGYKIFEQVKFSHIKDIVLPIKPHTLLIDTIYTPVKQVNFNIKKIYDIKGNLKESLCINLLTNGSVTPLRCLKEALKLLLELFFPFFIDPIFLRLYRTIKSSIKAREIKDKSSIKKYKSSIKAREIKYKLSIKEDKSFTKNDKSFIKKDKSSIKEDKSFTKIDKRVKYKPMIKYVKRKYTKKEKNKI